MKYSNIVLTVIAILLALLIIKIYIIPNNNFEKAGDNIFLDKKTGCIYIYSPKYGAYPTTIKMINLKTGDTKEIFTKD